MGDEEPGGGTDDQIATLKRVVPHLRTCHQIGIARTRMIRTLMETYLGRDAGQRVLSGRIVRGIAERMDDHLVQRFARLHAEQRYSTGRGNVAVERLF